ncbi:MAG TPA: protein kinase, partial [Polyangiaceae bacterium]|nr:protein kinase [Polyangiaceae bacterium]
MTDIVPRPRSDRFELVRPLGRGGTAETWLARRVGGLFAEQVCIKRSHCQPSVEGRRSLLEEARLLACVRHANVVQLLEALEDEDGEVFLVLEFVQGADLRALSRALRARGRVLRPAVVAAIAMYLCRALAAAQRAVPCGLV